MVLTDHTQCERGYLPFYADKIRAALPGVSVRVSEQDADPLVISERAPVGGPPTARPCALLRKRLRSPSWSPITGVSVALLEVPFPRGQPWMARRAGVIRAPLTA